MSIISETWIAKWSQNKISPIGMIKMSEMSEKNDHPTWGLVYYGLPSLKNFILETEDYGFCSIWNDAIDKCGYFIFILFLIFPNGFCSGMIRLKYLTKGICLLHCFLNLKILYLDLTVFAQTRCLEISMDSITLVQNWYSLQKKKKKLVMAKGN